jgi:phosphoenolpyruvate carboxykinase (GTP)
MKPFCGYNYGDYWRHWLRVGAGLKQPPRIFHVNWFRQDAAGQFLWPGYGDNLRVLAWMLGRCAGSAGAQDTAIGYLPTSSDLNLAGLDVDAAAMGELTSVNAGAWQQEIAGFRRYLADFGERVPAALWTELDGVERRLQASSST